MTEKESEREGGREREWQRESTRGDRGESAEGREPIIKPLS